MTSTTTTAAPTRPEPTTSERRRAIPRAGWMVIASKEFGDHLLSSRFYVLAIIMALAAGQASCILQRAPQQILDLTVDAAKIRSRPSLQRVVDLWIEPKRERFFIWHHAL